jgi:pimeloyl-ACP methyl ester carboxylesterase
VSGLDIAAFHDAARAIGVRIISPDRPGLGSSSPAPGRTTADWAGDVAALLDVLAVERAAVLGWSMGGQYALACAAVISDRVSRTVVIAGALPLDDPGAFEELNAIDRRLTALSRNHPHVARTSFASLGRIARHAPRAWTRVMTRDATPEEAEALRALADPGLASAAAAALGCPSGMVEEYLAWVRPWGFEPEAITRPVHIRHGDADSLVPPHWGEELARRIPGAEIDLLPGEGHFLGFRHQADILGDLVSD